MGQRKRKQKISKGTGRGAKSVSVPAVQLVLMGKGAFQAFKPLGSEGAR